MCKTPLIIWNKESTYRKTTGALAETALDTSDLDVIFDHGAPVDRGVAKPSVCTVEDHHFPFRIVPCGRCVDCVKSKRSGWYVRCRRQIECGTYAAVYWVLWTWNDYTIPTTKEELSSSIRRFKDRLRKSLGYTPDHFIVTERANDDRFTKRLHMHGFLCFKKTPPTFQQIKDLWECEGFMRIRKLGVLPDGRHITPMAAVTYSMKYMFKAFESRVLGDKLSGCIYASLGFGLAGFSSRSFRLKLREDPTFRLSETFDGLYRYPLPRYLSERVYLQEAARPAIDIRVLLIQLFGEEPPDAMTKEDFQTYFVAKQNAMLKALGTTSHARQVADLTKIYFLFLKNLL